MVKAIASSPQATPISAAGATAATWFLRGVSTCDIHSAWLIPMLVVHKQRHTGACRPMANATQRITEPDRLNEQETTLLHQSSTGIPSCHVLHA